MQNSAPRELSITPRGLNRSQAAKYIGVSVGLFSEMIAKGFMPEPRMMNTRQVWDKQELDSAFDDLPYANQPTIPTDGPPSDFI